jgi:hypothetical protein
MKVAGLSAEASSFSSSSFSSSSSAVDMSVLQGLVTICLYFEAFHLVFCASFINNRINPIECVSKRVSNVLDAPSYSFQTEIQNIRCKNYP